MVNLKEISLMRYIGCAKSYRWKNSGARAPNFHKVACEAPSELPFSPVRLPPKDVCPHSLTASCIPSIPDKTVTAHRR